VGCAQLNFAQGGELVAVEGDPRSPVNEGRLCPKGANTLQLSSNPHRVTRVKWRAPGSRTWEEKPSGWALDRIANLVKEARDRGFVERDAAGIAVNHTPNLALIGGSAQDNEEVYLAKKLFTGGLGLLGTENQARL
jgi:formate dehydrogenase major subunit